ncbi:hypothetical protein BCR43DRAFT_500236 [Syncephalastrum racemosum]|uniref:Uncharacterized protein n=1 Tax=Syncephalastrum racemosum TaxID=13706 RepID=A0A1X2HRD0_SYNRA|nr:hypothetical protein BCR43DRAFT_500236 [Syncephalastrum racemosum]
MRSIPKAVVSLPKTCKLQLNRDNLDISEVSDGTKIFKVEAEKYGYLRKTFPESDETTKTCAVLAREILEYPPTNAGDRVKVPHHLRQTSRSKSQYKYLLNGSRFARPDFDESKPLFQNKCLAFFMVEIFYRSASNSRLSTEEGDRNVSKALLILTYTMVYMFHLRN